MNSTLTNYMCLDCYGLAIIWRICVYGGFLICGWDYVMAVWRHRIDLIHVSQEWQWVWPEKKIRCFWILFTHFRVESPWV